jgi:putative glutamine amidotransferase
VKRPKVGITLAIDSHVAGRYALRQDYVRSVAGAGGLSVALPPAEPESAGEVLEGLDALLLTGGGDIDPELYGGETHPLLAQVARERDLFEIALCRLALERALPLLCICRGAQVLNVALGGTLVQDIPSQVGRSVVHDGPGERWERSHEVRISPESRLAKLLGGEVFSVNSLHHQSVKHLGEGVVVSAVSPEDGVIEGIEVPEKRFAVGVQWHPEAFWSRSQEFQGIFRALVEEARQ